jgi:hypothetical protein
MVLSDLQQWYSAQCDGDWEHGSGINIDTLDNPGWSLKVNLEGTLLEAKLFSEINIKNDRHSWMHCSVKDKQFLGAGDPSRLEEMLTIFITWAKTEPDWLRVEYE